MKVTYWDSIGPEFTGASAIKAPTFAKIAIFFILILPLNWIPSLYTYYRNTSTPGQGSPGVVKTDLNDNKI